jgi:hypothetical protein
MNRLRRVIWAVAGGVLLLAMPALWGVSYLRGDSILWLRGGGMSFMVNSYHGRVGVWIMAGHVTMGQPPQLVHLADAGFAESAIGWGPDNGFAIHGRDWLYWCDFPAGQSMLGAASRLVVLPHWLLCVPAAGSILLAARRGLRRRYRRRRGLCEVCGYDLRHSAERCPECGTPRLVAV